MKQLFLALCLMIPASIVSASSVHISVHESGGNVILDGSGSIDLTGLPALETRVFGDGSEPFIPGGRSQFNLFMGFLVDTADLSSGFQMNDYSPLTAAYSEFSVGGDNFLIQENGSAGDSSYFAVPVGYESDDQISFQWTYAGTTIAALDFNFGTVASFGNNTVTLGLADAPISAVPLPASGLLLVAGMGGLISARRKRKA